MTTDDLAQQHRVQPGTRVELGSIDPTRTPGLSGPEAVERAAAEALHAENIEALRRLQYRLWAEARRSLLVVLQGMDTAGKDGTIRHVLGPLNPQGVRIAAFKQPTPEELAHDFLWRVHARSPRAGEIVVFNRSHYEDVLVVRVLGLVPEPVWRARFDRINEFEALLTQAGTAVVKIMLHISKDEQRKRLQARLDDPEKRWKFSRGDLETRKRWEDYQRAYEEAIERCNTPDCPWHIVPADEKWYRNWAISSILRARLERMDPKPPPPEADLDGLVVE
ncbi:MAG: PPK2 family polyphosphate kinase [Phycisphaerales bacterium]